MPRKKTNPVNITDKFLEIQNELTLAVKQSILDVFKDLQADPEHSVKAFAMKYPKEFYSMAIKLGLKEGEGEQAKNDNRIQVILPGEETEP